MKIYTTGEVARLVGVQAHRIVYAIQTGKLHEPEQERHAGQRCFSEDDVRAIARYFRVENLIQTDDDKKEQQK